MRDLYKEIRFFDPLIDEIRKIDDPVRARIVAIEAGKRYRLLAKKPLPPLRRNEWYFMLFGLVGMTTLVSVALTMLLLQLRYWQLETILNYVR